MKTVLSAVAFLAFSLFAEDLRDPWLSWDRMAARYPEEAEKIEILRKENPAAAGAKLQTLILLDVGRTRFENAKLTAAAREAKADPARIENLRKLAGERYDRMVQEKQRLAERLQKQLESLRRTGAPPGVIAREQANLNRVVKSKPGNSANRQDYIEKTVRRMLNAPESRRKGKPKVLPRVLRTESNGKE